MCVVFCSLFVVCGLLFVVGWWLLVVVRCLLWFVVFVVIVVFVAFVVFVVCCMVYVVLFVGEYRCSLFVVRCSLSVVRCVLFVVCCDC